MVLAPICLWNNENSSGAVVNSTPTTINFPGSFWYLFRLGWPRNRGQLIFYYSLQQNEHMTTLSAAESASRLGYHEFLCIMMAGINKVKNNQVRNHGCCYCSVNCELNDEWKLSTCKQALYISEVLSLVGFLDLPFGNPVQQSCPLNKNYVKKKGRLHCFGENLFKNWKK